MRLTLSLGHRCNLRCSYCYGGEKSDRRMSLEVMRTALDLAFDHPDGMLRITPFGGEPLLELDLLAALVAETRSRELATGKRARLTLTTNGTLLAGRGLDILERAGFDVTVSLDGDDRAHDCARRFPDGRGSFRAVLEGARRASGRLGRIKTVSVLHPGNVRRLPASFRFISSLGVTHMSFVPDYDATWDGEALGWLGQAMEGLADAVIDRYRAGSDFLVQPLHDKIVGRLKQGFGPRDMCDFGCAEYAVAPSGRIYPCERLIGEDRGRDEVVIGHVEGGVDGHRVSALVEAKNRPRPDCLGCAIIDRCMWWCGCANRSLTGRVDGASEILCTVEQMCVRAADRVASTLYAEGNPPFLGRYYQAASAARR